MASPAKRLQSNVAGDFFVDSTCIDCGTCRWVAPQSFDSGGDQSRVYRQPTSEAETQRALAALVACPTASIGTDAGKYDVGAAIRRMPELIEDGVHYCGFASPDSFGAASYLIVREAGNVLVDSPRFAAPLVNAIKKLGGIRTMFLTHQDDVADHEKFAREFGCERVMHRQDVNRTTQAVETQLDGTDEVRLADDLLVIPTPGHTAGSACLLYKDKFLFTGDHLAWSKRLGHVYAFKDANWFEWGETVKSTAKLRPYRFEWLLPGHGWPWHGTAEEAAQQLEKCLEWMGHGGRADGWP